MFSVESSATRAAVAYRKAFRAQSLAGAPDAAWLAEAASIEGVPAECHEAWAAAVRARATKPGGLFVFALTAAQAALWLHRDEAVREKAQHALRSLAELDHGTKAPHCAYIEIRTEHGVALERFRPASTASNH